MITRIEERFKELENAERYVQSQDFSLKKESRNTSQAPSRANSPRGAGKNLQITFGGTARIVGHKTQYFNDNIKPLRSMFKLELSTLQILIVNRYDGLLAMNHVENTFNLEKAWKNIKKVYSVYDSELRVYEPFDGKDFKNQEKQQSMMKYRVAKQAKPFILDQNSSMNAEMSMRQSITDMNRMAEHVPRANFPFQDQQSSSEDNDQLVRRGMTVSEQVSFDHILSPQNFKSNCNNNGKNTHIKKILRKHYQSIIDQNMVWKWIIHEIYYKQRFIGKIFFNRFMAHQRLTDHSSLHLKGAAR